jgi:hypothetical protein
MELVFIFPTAKIMPNMTSYQINHLINFRYRGFGQKQSSAIFANAED